jgi:hypothetical protein
MTKSSQNTVLWIKIDAVEKLLCEVVADYDLSEVKRVWRLVCAEAERDQPVCQGCQGSKDSKDSK